MELRIDGRFGNSHLVGKRFSLVHLMWRCWTAGTPQENTHPINIRHQSRFRTPLSLEAEFSDRGGEVQRNPRGLPSPRVEKGVRDHQAHLSALPKISSQETQSCLGFHLWQIVT